MLFINRSGQVRLVTDQQIPVPYVQENFQRNVLRVRAAFMACRRDPGFVDALTAELRRRVGAVAFPRDILDAGEQAIADGLIGVARALPETAEVTFDPRNPVEPHHWNAVRFARADVASAFVQAVIGGNEAAFQAAFAASAARQYVASFAAEAGGGALAERVATLLIRRALALFPCDALRKVLRLAWVEQQVASAPTADGGAGGGGDAAPPPAPSTPAPSLLPEAGPMSVLPDPPALLSPQAQTLIEAAKNGAPFCEECARRAAEMAGV